MAWLRNGIIGMTETERLAIKQKLKDDFPHYAAKCLKIRPKSGSIEPFVFNRAQQYVHEKLEEQLYDTGKVRALVLKARQQGMSTYIGGRFYHKVTHRFGCKAFIMAHEKEATDNLYDMAKRYWEHTPEPVKPQTSKSNAKELVFGLLDSGYKLGTAENKKVGRSATIQLLHGSEVAFWNHADEHAKGLLQAVPSSDNTEIILESTANGIGNFFHQEWQKAEAGISDYIAIFVPWFWQSEYSKTAPLDFKRTGFEEDLAAQYGLTNNQLHWRRKKVIDLSVNGADGEKNFRQEYPCNAVEAFILSGEDSYISGEIVMRARKTQGVEPYGSLLLGVDPARFGDDRTAIIRRRGRCAFGMETHIKKDTMEIAGLVYSIYKRESPTRIFVDVGGLGAGVVDRLNELGLADVVVAVNAGAKPLDADRYRNKRSEMWGTLLEWLNDEPNVLPDSDELQADLCNIKYQIDSNSRLVMEAKEHMKRRGVRSCDTADALCFVANTLIRTPKGQIPIERLKIGDEVVTPLGNTKICKTWISETTSLTTVNFSNGSKLCGKGEHKVFTWNVGECRLDALQLTFDMETYTFWRRLKWLTLKLLCIKTRSLEFRAMVDIISRKKSLVKRKLDWKDFCIVVSGQTISALFRTTMLCITKTMIGVTTIFPILRLCPQESITNTICEKDLKIQNSEKEIEKIWIKPSLKQPNGTPQSKGWLGTKSMEKEAGTIDARQNSLAQYALNRLKDILTPDSALNHADKRGVMPSKKQNHKSVFGALKNFWLTNIATWRVVPKSVQIENVPTTLVYNLTLEKHNAYYANDILAFNCLTFANPNPNLDIQLSKQRDNILQSMADDFTKKFSAITKSRGQR